MRLGTRHAASACRVFLCLDMTANKEYTYTYEDGKIVRAAECDITLSGEIVTAKHLVNSIVYSYDSDGKLTKKRITAGGKEQTVYCENPENENAVVKFTAGGKTVTSHSKTDSFGRKVFDELQLGTGFVSRQFHYHAGEVTDEHKAEQKLKSSPTTQLVSQIVLSGGRTISYEYDAEERITEVTDSVGGVTTSTAYTYDALGQLLTETVNGAPVNVMTYDRYGNIASKNGTVYTYGDAVWKDWKDLLTKVGDQPITYDAQGNPTAYLGHTLAWEKGRQLKSFDGNTYTYNANGIRTSKTVGGVKHTYALDGTKILCEKWNDNTIIPLYDNEDGVCGILYNDEPFYFQKNLQGDVIGIMNKDAQSVAKYSYDAWGVCTVVSDTSDCAIATVNPYRYRGYYYDPEIGLYYVSSRYYDPEIGQWINEDNPMFLGVSGTALSYSLFTYCENNPVNCVDLTGYAITPANVIGAIVGLVLGAVGGYFLSRFLADKIGLEGWKRVVFIVGISAIISAAAGVIGYFIGPYIAKAFRALLNGLRGLFKPKIGTQLGRLGTLTRNTKPVIKGLTKHGLQRMTQRGVSKALAQKIINTGYAVAQGGGKVLFFTKEGVVMLTSAGQVVTAYSSEYFDEAMQAIVNLFYK